jgi:hypothetical protein
MVYYLYRWGLWFGLLIIITVSLWDILTKGLGCLFVFWQYSIAWKGVLLIWIGLGLILGSIWAERMVKHGAIWNFKFIPKGVLPK